MLLHLPFLSLFNRLCWPQNDRLANFERVINKGYTAKNPSAIAVHALFSKINTLPDGKPFFKKLVKLMDDRKQMVEYDKLDWAIGELLAYASIAAEGHPVRLSGQDSERGTFSHRHAARRTPRCPEVYQRNARLGLLCKGLHVEVHNAILGGNLRALTRLLCASTYCHRCSKQNCCKIFLNFHFYFRLKSWCRSTAM